MPWLLFGLIGGALADRLDRRRVMVSVAGIRATLVGILTVAVIVDWASMPLLYVVFFLIAVGETLFDTSAAALLPALVPKDISPGRTPGSVPPSPSRTSSSALPWEARYSRWPPRCRSRSARPG